MGKKGEKGKSSSTDGSWQKMPKTEKTWSCNITKAICSYGGNTKRISEKKFEPITSRKKKKKIGRERKKLHIGVHHISEDINPEAIKTRYILVNRVLKTILEPQGIKHKWLTSNKNYIIIKCRQQCCTSEGNRIMCLIYSKEENVSQGVYILPKWLTLTYFLQALLFWFFTNVYYRHIFI